jgi:hypothetical protein
MVIIIMAIDIASYGNLHVQFHATTWCPQAKKTTSLSLTMPHPSDALQQRTCTGFRLDILRGKKENLPATQRLAEVHARDVRWDTRDPRHPGVEEDRG